MSEERKPYVAGDRQTEPLRVVPSLAPNAIIIPQDLAMFQAIVKGLHNWCYINSGISIRWEATYSQEVEISSQATVTLSVFCKGGIGK